MRIGVGSNNLPQINIDSLPKEVVYNILFHLEDGLKSTAEENKDLKFTAGINKDLIFTAGVTQKLREHTINYSLDINYFPIIYFADFLSEKLKDMAQKNLPLEKAENCSSTDDVEYSGLYANQIKRLINLTFHIPAPNLNFIKIHSTPAKLKKEIFNILKNLETKDLDFLASSVKRYLLSNKHLSKFENLFEEIEDYKKLDEDLKNANSKSAFYGSF